MIFDKNNGSDYIFSKEVYLESDEREEQISPQQIEELDGKNVSVAHSYLGYIDDTRIASSWCKEVK